MASLPPIKNITKDDLRGAPEWVNALLSPLNQFMQSVYSALDRNLTLGDNISGNTVTIDINTKSTYDSVVSPNEEFTTVSLKNPIKTRPTALIIGNIIDRDTQRPASLVTGMTGTHLRWDYLNNNLRILYLYGLEPSKKYTITLLVF